MWRWALPVPSCPLHNEGRYDHGSLSPRRPLPRASAFQCTVPHRPKGPRPVVWQAKHCGSTDPRLLTQTTQAAEGPRAALPQIFLVGTSLPHSIHHSQVSPQMLSWGENVRGHTYMVFIYLFFITLWSSRRDSQGYQEECTHSLHGDLSSSPPDYVFLAYSNLVRARTQHFLMYFPSPCFVFFSPCLTALQTFSRVY